MKALSSITLRLIVEERARKKKTKAALESFYLEREEVRQKKLIKSAELVEKIESLQRLQELEIKRKEYAKKLLETKRKKQAEIAFIKKKKKKKEKDETEHTLIILDQAVSILESGTSLPDSLLPFLGMIELWNQSVFYDDL